jgi:multidrug resistance efflux pump
MFVIEPSFAAVTAPAIQIYAPTAGRLTAHELEPGEQVTRDQPLVRVVDPEATAELALAQATLRYNEHLVANLREAVTKAQGGRLTVVSGGADEGAPTLTDLTPLEAQARIEEFESSREYAQARIRALETRVGASVVHAPCECIVQSIRSGDGDYWVQEGALIATLIKSDAEDTKVEALVHLNEIARIEAKERAHVILPGTKEVRSARVAAIQLEGREIERAGFPRWARQDMSHGSVILEVDDPLPPSLVGHPVEVRFVDTDTEVGRLLAEAFGALHRGFSALIGYVDSGFGSGAPADGPSRG